MKKSVFVTTLTALTLFAAGEANAALPTVGPYGTEISLIASGFDCQATPGVRRQLQTGADLGYEQVLTAWESGPNGDPSGVAQFITDVLGIVNTNAALGLAGLNPANSNESFVACRFVGFIGGAIVGVADVLADTVLSCSADGLYWSNFAAGLFCELAEVSDGLIAPAVVRPAASDVCGIAFEATCEAAYEPNARAYVSNSGADCDQWVDADAAVFNSHKEESCTYSSTGN